MADADVPITAGTGTKIDTRTVGAGTDEHRQVVVIGDPSTAANVATVSAGGAVLTSSGQLPASLGQKTSALSLAVGDAADSASGSVAMTATNNAVTVSTASAGACGIQITGTWTGTVAFEATTDNTTYFAVNGVASVSGAQVSTATANGQWRVNAGGYQSVRVRSSVAGTGSATVTLFADPASTMSTLAEPLPAGTNLLGAVNNSQIAGTSVSVNAGTVDAGTQRVILASNQNVVPVSDNSGSLTVDAPVGTPVFVTPTPSTTGGWTPYTFGPLSTTVQTVKASAGTLGGHYIYNPNATVAYVQIFDISGTVTLGTSTPVLSFGIPGSSAANMPNDLGRNFANAIKIAATTTRAGSTAVGTGLDVNFDYK